MVGEINGMILDANLSEDELRQVNSFVCDQLKAVRQRNSQQARLLFNVGDSVGFGQIGGRGKRAYKEGEIVAIKRTRAQVRVGVVTWTVPLNMLKSV